MRKYIFLSFVILVSLSANAGIVVRDLQESWTIPKSLYNRLFSIATPDIAELYFINLPFNREKKREKAILYFIVGGKRYDSSALVAPKLYEEFILALVSNHHVKYYVAGYKSQGNRFFKIVELNANSLPKRQLMLMDPKTGLLLETKYYKTGEILSEGELQLTQLKDTANWYGAKTERTGKFTQYYPGGKINYVTWFIHNQLKDSVYTCYHENGQVKSNFRTFNGKVTDSASFYNESGELVKVILYNKGFPVRTLIDKTQADNHKKAFLFGANKYEVEENGKKYIYYNNLAGCVNDVNILSLALEQVNGFQGKNIVSVIDQPRASVIAALDRFVQSASPGDKIFLHFSGNSYKDSFTTGIACADVNRLLIEPGYKGYIDSKELQGYIEKLQLKVGTYGQVVVSLDACHAGDLNENKGADERNNVSTRGEGGNMLLSLSKTQNVPLFVFTSSSGSELSSEWSFEGKTYGLYSLALAQSLFNPANNSIEQIFADLQNYLSQYNENQHPELMAAYDMPLFENVSRSNRAQTSSLPSLKSKGNAFVVSVGISRYSGAAGNLKFSNSANDAIAYSSYLNAQFEEFRDNRKIYSDLLVDSAATRANILRVVNNAISNSTPDDYFIFNFSGYCKPLTDDQGRQITYFVPYGLKNISDINEIRKEGISLTQLKDLLQMIPANNQLFITEAGSTATFQKEFIQALIETNPTIASLTNKNRIFIVPNTSGLDNFYCQNKLRYQGPLNYYLTNLPAELNIFGLFEGGIYSNAIRFALTKSEVECDYFKTSYFDIFFEKDYIKDLEIFLPEGMSTYRGTVVENTIKKEQQNLNTKKYALVIGTDTYAAKDWDYLPNALLDARRLADELHKGFDYDVTLLENKPADSIYAAIKRFSDVLQPNDQLIICLSGHGDYDSKFFDDGFVVCTDSKSKSIDPYRNSYIAYSKLSRLLNNLPAKQVFLLLDVCFGGNFGKAAAKAKGRGDYDDVVSAEYYSEKMKLNTRLYLAAGSNVIPDGYQGKHSPFAQRLLQAMQDRGGNAKMLTSSSLYEFVKKLPSKPIIASFGDDELGSEFILIAK